MWGNVWSRLGEDSLILGRTFLFTFGLRPFFVSLLSRSLPTHSCYPPVTSVEELGSRVRVPRAGPKPFPVGTDAVKEANFFSQKAPSGSPPVTFQTFSGILLRRHARLKYNKDQFRYELGPERSGGPNTHKELHFL